MSLLHVSEQHAIEHEPGTVTDENGDLELSMARGYNIEYVSLYA